MLMDHSWNFMGQRDSLICLFCQMIHFGKHYLAKLQKGTCAELPKNNNKKQQLWVTWMNCVSFINKHKNSLCQY